MALDRRPRPAPRHRAAASADERRGPWHVRVAPPPRDQHRASNENGPKVPKPHEMAPEFHDSARIAMTYGVGMRREHDGDRGRPSGRLSLGRRGREDDVDLLAGELGGRFVDLLDGPRPSELDDEVLAFDIADIVQARPKRLYPGRPGRGGTEAQVSETRDFRLRLCARKHRPREQRRTGTPDHLATPHGVASRPSAPRKARRSIRASLPAAGGFPRGRRDGRNLGARACRARVYPRGRPTRTCG